MPTYTSSSTQTEVGDSISFLLISDTHDYNPREASSGMKDPEALRKVDVLIHSGDLTMCGGMKVYKRAMDTINAIPATIRLVIPGNHDLELDPKYWATHLDEGDEIEEFEQALAFLKNNAGITYLEKGYHDIKLPDGRFSTLYAGLTSQSSAI